MFARAAKARVSQKTVAARTANKNSIVKIAMPTASLNPSVTYPAGRQAEILKAYHERSSLRGLERTFGVARQTVAKWLRQQDAQLPVLPPLEPAQADAVLELDELGSFVGAKKTNAGSG